MTRSSSLAMERYSIEPRTRRYVKGYGFLSVARKYKKRLLGTGLDALKTASKKVVHKTGEFIGNKSQTQKQNNVPVETEKLRNKILL